MSYEPECLDLAIAFGNKAGLSDAEIARFAQMIQDAVDENLAYLTIVRRNIDTYLEMHASDPGPSESA